MIGGLSAFPHEIDACVTKGLSKREYFAAMAMQALLINRDIASLRHDQGYKDEICFLAIEMANRMAKELKED